MSAIKKFFQDLLLLIRNFKIPFFVLQIRKIPFLVYYLPLSILFMEIVLKINCFGEVKIQTFLFTLVFSVSLGFLAVLLCSLLSKKINKILFSVFLSILTAIFVVQTIYFQVFKTFTTIFSATTGASRIFEYWREILAGIQSSALALIFTILPLAGWLFLKKHVELERASFKILFFLLAGVIIFNMTGTILALSADEGDTSPKYLYTEAFIPNLAGKNFGLMTMIRLDIKNLFFGMESSTFFEPEEDIEILTVESTTKMIQEINTSMNTEAAALEEHDYEENETEMTEIPTQTIEEKEPVIYPDNILNIDFDILFSESENDTVSVMHEYFKNVSPTEQNAYTGMFSGKNLVSICAEAFSNLALDPELTPTLYKLANEGFVFENFYNPVWGVSTSDGEYTTCTSLLPKSGVWSHYLSGKNDMPFTMGNQLGQLGYSTNAYHNNTYDYYRRDVSHPNMGYVYKGIGNGLEMDDEWPRSDLQMFEKTIPEYIHSDKFHTYYMTVSGHLNYNFSGNAMSYKHMEKVADLPYCESGRAYIACQIELDLAVAYLLEQLAKEGILDDTVIVLSGDHYPYGLTPDEMAEIAGHEIETEFETYKSTLILWNSAMVETINIEKPCYSVDILPTLSNLFGVQYDSRLLMGRDILSDSPGLVIFNTRSWISEHARYNAVRGEFIPNEGVQLPESYQETISKQVKNKFELSAKILEVDYYQKVFNP